MTSDITTTQNNDRIFCLGVNRTGTTSINECFEVLKLTPVASSQTYTPEAEQRIDRFFRHKNYADMLELAGPYRAFQDWPWNMWSMYQHLDSGFPDSRFILTERDPESWWRSTERWLSSSAPEILHRLQLHLRVDQPSRETMTESYLRYNQDVKRYFRGSDKLLVMDVEKGDGWDKLCRFLRLPLPQDPFPHRNRQDYRSADTRLVPVERRFKHGIECQACGKLNTVRTGNLQRRRGDAQQKRPLSQALRPMNLAASVAESISQDWQHSARGRRALYSSHQLIKSLKAPLRNARINTLTRRSHDELAVVSCFFNPGASRRRVDNYRAFLQGMRERGVRCLVVELAFGDNPHAIDDYEDTIQLRCDDILWHKERLLNIGIRRLLDEGARKIAWLDGDIRFDNGRWPEVISACLDRVNLCQVFEDVSVQLQPRGAPVVAPSAISYFQHTGNFYTQQPRVLKGLLLGQHMAGQCGYGWAARAEVLEQALLFDKALVGGGDKLMLAATLERDLDNPRLEATTYSKFHCQDCGHRNRSASYSRHFLQWAARWNRAVAGKVGFAPLHLRDMYHGKRSDRGYFTRLDILYRHGYDPVADLAEDDGGCFAWSSPKQAMHREVEAYFLSRREDV